MSKLVIVTLRDHLYVRFNGEVSMFLEVSFLFSNIYTILGTLENVQHWQCSSISSAVVLVEFDPTMYTVSEGGVVSFTIRRLTPTTTTVSVIFNTVPGSATGVHMISPAILSTLSFFLIVLPPSLHLPFLNLPNSHHPPSSIDFPSLSCST